MSKTFFEREVIQGWTGECFKCGIEESMFINRIRTLIKCKSCGFIGSVKDKKDSSMVEITELTIEA